MIDYRRLRCSWFTWICGEVSDEIVALRWFRSFLSTFLCTSYHYYLLPLLPIVHDIVGSLVGLYMSLRDTCKSPFQWLAVLVRHLLWARTELTPTKPQRYKMLIIFCSSVHWGRLSVPASWTQWTYCYFVANCHCTGFGIEYGGLKKQWGETKATVGDQLSDPFKSFHFARLVRESYDSNFHWVVQVLRAKFFSLFAE